MKHAGPLEIEVKLRVPSVGVMRPRLLRGGFNLVHPDTLETSQLWDRSGELLGQGSALRLRQYGGRSLLTWKGPRLDDPQLKIRPEVETEVADPAATEGILRALGYAPALTMVKTRSIWARGDLEACLDQTPYGCFLELEGEPEAIRTAMAQLGLGPAQIEPRSYAALYSGGAGD